MLLSESAEWADVQPVWPGEDEQRVVAIAYSERDEELLAYFRALVAKVRVLQGRVWV